MQNDDLIIKFQEFSSLLNSVNSRGLIPFIDINYPNLDGVLDSDIAADCMMLRDILLGIKLMSESVIDKINFVLDD